MHAALVRLLAPILSFTCEEIWQHTKFGAEKCESVHMAYFPMPEELSDGIIDEVRSEAAGWDRLVPIRDQVLKALDTAREDKLIGASLEASVTLRATGELYSLLDRFGSDLPTWFIVSQVELQPGSSDGLEINVDRARGDKCERCWKYTIDVGNDEDFPTVCAACAAVLREFFS